MRRDILLLGEPRLYEASAPVLPEELPGLLPVIADLHDTLMAYRAERGAGRAIAAPQIGVAKRLMYMHIDGEGTALINPELTFPDEERFAVLDDCMSFPHLKVRVLRHQRCVVTYADADWHAQKRAYEGDLAELIQHEYDHLDGILATMRAIDQRSFFAV